jgi:mannose-6-phosphate isomerase
LTLIEVQQNSETTYRLYDYGRPRELHLDDGIAAADPRPYTPWPSPRRIDDGRTILVEGPKFVLERLAGGGARTIALPDGVTAWLIPVAGDGVVDGVAFAAGECLTLTGAVEIDAGADADLLLAYPGERRIP